MKIHEYQGKALLARHDVPVPRGEPAFSAPEAGAVARRLGGRVVVKAQIHAGGRGKGGGVKVAADAVEAERIAGEMLGMTLVTPQTGPGGRVVRRLLIEEALDVASELYLGVLVDRSAGRPVLMASASGGMDIEAVAAETPELIHRAHADPGLGLAPFQARNLAHAVGLSGPAARAAAALVSRAYGAFVAADASLLEINPLVVTAGGAVLALDAKVTLDDNASFRHADLADLRDLGEEEPLEIEASRHALNYIRLDGDIGCMVNGAGLAMATMDIIKVSGGEPANFLDVGGGRQRRPDPQRVPHPAVGRPGARGADQHFRRHPAVRRARGRGHRGRHRARRRRAGGHPHGRDQRGGRAAHARGERAELHHRGQHGAGGAAGRRHRAPAVGAPLRRLRWRFSSTNGPGSSCRG